jgi:APA family basic amino acid/polyamine antiporter
MCYCRSDRIGCGGFANYFGSVGTLIIAVMIMISTFACNNGLIMAGARVYYTMAQDGVFFKKSGFIKQSKCTSVVYLGAMHLGFGFVFD